MRRVALVARSADAQVSETQERLTELCDAREIAVHVDEHGPFGAREALTRMPRDELGSASDLVIAIGGDGTMLDAAHIAARAGTPLVGINRGRLGFLADISPEDTTRVLSDILDGLYVEESRMLLAAELERDGQAPVRAIALNDIVIQKFDIGRMLEVEVDMDGTYVNTHRGDGLIVTTPTGSTAYALSGGGPIMAPGLNAVAMVPICPHTLSDRPVVVPASARLELRILEQAGGHAQIMADGQAVANMHRGDTLHVIRAEQRVTLLHPLDYDYFRILRKKLAWGRGRPDDVK